MTISSVVSRPIRYRPQRHHTRSQIRRVPSAPRLPVLPSNRTMRSGGRSGSHRPRGGHSYSQQRPITVNSRRETNFYTNHNSNIPSYAQPGPAAPVSHSLSIGAPVPMSTHTHTHTHTTAGGYPVAVPGLGHSLPVHLGHPSYSVPNRYLDRSYLGFMGYANANDRYVMQEWLALPHPKPPFQEYLVYRWAGVAGMNQLDPMGWTVLQRYQQERLGVF